MNSEWRKVGDYDWWLLSKDAPDPVQRDGKWWSGKRGNCSYPPEMVMSWAGNDSNSCCHLYSYSNGAEPASADDDDVDYLHICDPADFVEELQAFIAASGWKRAEWDIRS